jgi:hypothetical protein
MTQVETVEKPYCPCFDLFYERVDKKVGFCGLLRYPREDGSWPGDCPYSGNAERCLREGEPKIRKKLIEELGKKMENLITKNDYFTSLLEQSRQLALTDSH